MHRWRLVGLVCLIAVCAGCVEQRTPTSISYSLDPWAIFIFNVVVMGPLCCYINYRKGYSLWIGFFAGLIGGCLGLLVCLVIPSRNVPRQSAHNIPAARMGYGPPSYPGPPRPGFGPPGYVPPSQHGSSPGMGYAPGWFPDPHGRASRRYFDGTRWTDQVVDDQSGQQRSDPV